MPLAAAEKAFATNDLDQARRLALANYERVPAAAAELLGHIALAADDIDSAVYYGQAAVENHNPMGYTILADAVGRRGQRAQAERIAEAALANNPRSGLLRAVLGEQRVRQAKWEAGTADFVEALRLEERALVRRHLWRVLRALIDGYNADKIPRQRASDFIAALIPYASSDHHLTAQLDAARQALHRGSRLPAAEPVAAPSSPPVASQPPRPRPTAPRQQRISTHNPAPLPSLQEPPPTPMVPGGRIDRGSLNALNMLMKRDRELNEELQAGVQSLGLPTWPSNRAEKLDTIEGMRPQLLAIDQAEFQREHLNVTNGSVATEILVERTLQALLTPDTYGRNIPAFDTRGLTQLETALWSGALDRMTPVSAVYVSETKQCSQEVLALGAFLGACVIAPAVATWSFARTPTDSTIETATGVLRPFDYAEAWVTAQDKDDVSLQEFLAEAQRLTGEEPPVLVLADMTENLKGAALSMRLAELWANFWNAPPDVAQQSIAETIRPLLHTEKLVIFAIAREFAPQRFANGPSSEIALAYVRHTGEFLTLESRKHFARLIGEHFGRLTPQHAANIAELLTVVHAPGGKLVSTPKLDGSRTDALLRFDIEVNGTQHQYSLQHSPSSDVPWRLMVSRG